MKVGVTSEEHILLKDKHNEIIKNNNVTLLFLLRSKSALN